MRINKCVLGILSTILTCLYVGAAEPTHGLIQVKQLMQDRPSLRLIVPENGDVWNFLIVNFTENVWWDPSPPELAPSYHSSFTINPDSSVSIHVDYNFRDEANSCKVLPPQQILSCVVYELYNVKHKARFQQLDKMVRDGDPITRDEYVMAMSKEEHDTMMSVQQFYLSIWSPYALNNNIDPCPQFWHRGIFADFDTWFRLNPRDGYPWDVYGRFYDEWRASKK